MFKIDKLDIHDGDTLILAYNTHDMWDVDLISHMVNEIEQAFPTNKILAIPDTMFSSITVIPGCEEPKSFF